MYEHRDVVILHHGYADAAQVRTKARRNVRLLRREYTPENPDPVMMLEIGDSYKMLGEDDEAAAWYTAIISLSGAGRSYPEILSSAHFGMGTVLNKKGDYENAIAHLTLACTFIPDRPDALYGLAAAHDMRGEYEEAARLLEKIPGIAPYARSVGIDYRQAALKAYLRLERVYARLGKDRDMCAHIDEALQCFGMRPEVHAMHGRVLFRMGRLLEALHAFEKSVRIMAKDNIDAYLGLCAIYLRAGKTQEAVRTLESMEPAFSHSPRYCAFRALMGDERFQDYCPPDATPDDVIAEKKLLHEVYGFFA
jgi:tetratricopeptide (TPR) repeat protein